MDDDYYWRNGWYANPEDVRLFVQDRFNSMNYTTNLGRPAGRYLVGGNLCRCAGSTDLDVREFSCGWISRRSEW